MIGWTDPSSPDPRKPMKWLKSLNHENFIYPAHLNDPNPLNSPPCVFVPDTAILNKMIEVVARNIMDKNVLYSKFSDMEPAKPQWMIELNEEKLAQEALEKKILNTDESLSVSNTIPR